ncbi:MULTISPECIES: hypothetical protein [Streptomyces]|uniref:Uncharacterized protein n=1 Tax=Streptomyces sp. 900129855 TaxID=3155129 RepID=A0ABV2ZFW3_9ACTN
MNATRARRAAAVTVARHCTLAQYPAHRPGWTGCGHPQSTYTDHHPGPETRRVPRPSLTHPAH